MKRLVLFLSVILLISSCSNEKIIDDSSKSWKALIAVNQGEPKLQLVEYPSGNIINDDLYLSANGMRISSAPSLIAESGRLLFLVQKDEKKITVINSDNYVKKAEISFSADNKKPLALAFPQHGTTAYVIFEKDSVIAYIDLVAMKNAGYLNLGKICGHIDASENQVYVTNPRDNMISVIETNTNSKVAEINMPEVPQYVGFTADGLRAVCISSGKGKSSDDSASVKTNANVTLIDVASRKIIITQPLGVGYVKPLDQVPLNLSLASKLYSFIGTQTHLLRFNTKIGGNVARLDNGYFESITFNSRRDEILIVSKSGSLKTLNVSASQNYAVTMKKTLPEGFVCLIPR